MANAGAFKKGEKRPGQGRPKGVTNKDTALIRDMIAQALDDVGGVEYLASVAKSHPGPFLALVGKVMPVQVTGANGGPIEVRNMTDAQLAIIAAGGSV
jgi:hypothetical protein